MSRWRRLGIRVHVLNFFTQSAYAPRTAAREASAVSLLREREDRAALSAIGAMESKSLRLLDAPLRLNIPVSDVCKVSCDGLEDKHLIAAISALVRNDLILSPLGLGDHVDHLAVRSAAMAACGLGNLGFYEDLPYATWTTEEVLEEHLQASGASLRAVVIRAERPFCNKRRIAARYRSQITQQEADDIARFATRYGGERIWVPNRLARALRQRATRDRSTFQTE
jgi:LmbE family N-acetylglucosaminyl deacetylase